MINLLFKKNIVLIKDTNKLNKNNFSSNLFKIFFSGIGVGCLLCGLIPGFLSFQRIFYTDDSSVFLIMYCILFGLFLINIIGFILFSYAYDIFIEKKYIFLIPLGYIILLCLFSINAYFFTEFNLTENGYEVPFNILMYVIDILILFPIYGFYEYRLVQSVTKKIRKK